jgi:UBX domain
MVASFVRRLVVDVFLWTSSRLLLLPLRAVMAALFPPRDLDGLSPAVAEKAARQFAASFQQQQQTQLGGGGGGRNSNINPFVLPWSTSAFSTLRTQACVDHSLIVLYLHAPLHYASQHCWHTYFSSTSDLAQLLSNESATATTPNNTGSGGGRGSGDSATASSRPHRVVMLGLSIHSAQGAQLQNALAITAFPALAVLQPAGTSTLHLALKVEGYREVTTCLPQLQTVLHRHQSTVRQMEIRRLHRQQESELRRQQDEEYQATLAADRERDRQMEEQLRAEREEQERVRLEMEMADTALQRARRAVEENPEPSAATGGGTTTAMIRFCFPSGAKVNRRFDGSTATIATLRAYVKVYCADHGESMGDRIGLSTNFPRVSYTDDKDDDGGDNSPTLADAGLVPQAVLMVQDLDA